MSVARPGDDGEVVAGVGHGALSPYRALPAGRYAVALRAAGSPPDTPPALSTVVDLPVGGARTVVVGGSFAHLALTVLTDDLSAPPAGSARVRVLDGTDGGPLTVTAGGARLADGLAVGASGPAATVAAGTVDVVVRAGAAPVRVPLDLAAGSVISLLVVDGDDGGLTVRPVVDAAAPAAVPVGAVPAGGDPGAPAGAVIAGILGAAGLLGLRRSVRVVPLVTVLGPALLPAPAAAAPPAPPPTSVHLATVPAAAVPVRVRIPAAGVDGPLAAVGLDRAGALVPPADVRTAGWFGGGPLPGEPGPAVLAGHVNSGGWAGLFARLGELTVGDAVLVTAADGTVRRFTVTAVDRYPKAAFPTSAVYAATPDAELRLITCGGPFDAVGRSYTENVVVSARLAG